MKLTKKRATLLLCSVAVAAIAGSAIARPVHRPSRQGRRRRRRLTPTRDERNPYAGSRSRPQRRHERSPPSRRIKPGAVRAPRRNRIRTRPMAGSPAIRWCRKRANISAPIRPAVAACGAAPSWTWCSSAPVTVAAAISRSAIRTMAAGFRPQVGAIAVMGRRGGGHVGVVSGVDANGNPIIVSGNHNHTVAESVYPRSRISAYVMPELTRRQDIAKKPRPAERRGACFFVSRAGTLPLHFRVTGAFVCKFPRKPFYR